MHSVVVPRGVAVGVVIDFKNNKLLGDKDSDNDEEKGKIGK